MSDAAATPEPPPSAEIVISPSYEMVSQACAIAIQDAVAYLRAMETLAVAVAGALQEQAMNKRNVSDGALAIGQSAVNAAVATLSEVGAATAEILKTFPVGVP
jgi:hypothetical protein